MGFNQKHEHCSSSDLTSSSLGLSDLSDDATSSPSTTCDTSSSGPLFELSDLMAQLPIKRGLSKFYNGKSQTFASLLDVRSVEDLGKKEMSFCKRMKSYGGNLYKFGPKPTIAKRSPKKPCFSAKTSFLQI